MKIRTLAGIAAVTLSTSALAPLATAQEQYLGTIQDFPYNFCPRGWLPAEGQLLPISNNTALFSLLGTQFGGDGRTTFALPDLRPAKASPAQTAAPVIKAEVFQHCSFSGWSVALAPGQYALPDLSGFTDNEMSSIKLPEGWTAELHDGEALDGDALDVSGTMACLVDAGFNDRVSSLVIRSNSLAPPPPPTPTAPATDASRLKACIATVGIYPSRN